MLVSKKIGENKKYLKSVLEGCADVIWKECSVGRDGQIKCLLLYLEPTLGNDSFRSSSVGDALDVLGELGTESLEYFLRDNRIPDAAVFQDLEQAVDALMAGNTIMLVDGCGLALKIQDQGYPGMDVHSSDYEKASRGSEECFSDSVKTNASLLRKRLRTPNLKVKEHHIGTRSNTLVYVMYMDTIAEMQTVERMEERLKDYKIDAVLDSGVIEQLTENKSWSPFPQYQSTRRPDRAAEALLNGRVVVMSDNSPEALVLPVTLETFLEAADDRFMRFEIAVFVKILRCMAAFLAMTLPGLYLVAINFHNQLIPLKLLLSLSAAASGTPFPAVMEVFIMEIAFELLREAGIRMPGNMGNAIGIVGGLIVGQAAVEANLVSPIVVIVVALTALCSFTIPSEDLATAFRLLKFVFLILCGWLGYFGFLYLLLLVFFHAGNLSGFGTGYLSWKKRLLRKPLTREKLRSAFAREDNRVRLRKEKS